MSSASGFDVASGDLEPQYGEEWACEEVFVEEFDALWDIVYDIVTLGVGVDVSSLGLSV